jgi:hypothetical protein
VRGDKLGDKGLLTRPSFSWVACRTGFGSAASGKDGGMFKSPSEHIKGGEACSGLVGHSQPMIHTNDDKGTETVLVEVGECDLDSNIIGVEPSLGCAASGPDSPEGVASEGGLEECVVEETVDGSGQGLLSLSSLGNSGPDALPISVNLRLTEEVGSVVGLTCDGQEGMKVACFKRIIAEKHGKEGGSLHVADQQEEKSCVQERETVVIMKHKILSWNVRGLSNRGKRLRISNLLILWKVDIVCF